MQIKINDVDVNYVNYGNKEKDTVVYLHGWGQNIEMMKPVGDKLSKDNRVIILDLPGFGKSDEPLEEIGIYDYCSILEEFLNELKIKNPILMGHSFGGRISIIYASRNDVKKLILFGSPCIRKNKKPSLKERTLKSIIKLPGMKSIGEYAKKHIGSRDYKAASDIMRKVLVNTVNEDLSECAKKIKAPTLLMWGEYDQEASVEEAKELEGIIPDAGLIVFPNSTHYAYLENLQQVIKILKNFL